MLDRGVRTGWCALLGACLGASALIAAVGCSGDGDNGGAGVGPGAGDRAGTASTNAGSGGSGGVADGAVGDDGGSGGTTASGGNGGNGSGDTDAAADAGDLDAGGDGVARRWTESPWGVAPSHSSSVGIASWSAQIAQAGVEWVRGFDQANAASVLPVAMADGLQLSGIFSFSDPGPEQTFPVNSIGGAFEDYVTARIDETRGVVLHWEVWNEPPNFSANKSPADYAKVVVAAYDAAKAADPNVQVGLAAQSVNLNFLAQALDAGAAGHFDYVTVHPYETLGLVDAGFEAQYMSIVPTIRKLLADKSPGERDVPVWFTELGEPVGDAVTPEHQADTLVKAYVMGLAQGAHRIHWFEPLDGDSGPFGLIAGGSGDAPKRPSWIALSTLITELGRLPAYVGWTLLNDQHYAFVFEGKDEAVLIAWAGVGITDTVDFGASVHVIDPHTGDGTDVTSVALSHAPLLVRGVPESIVAQARASQGMAFRWSGDSAGDYGGASSVSYSAADGEHGLHPLGTATLVTIDGAPARDVSPGPGLSFSVDPSFLAYDSVALRITAELRRNGATNAGFNLKYESTAGWQGTGSWYTIPGADQWYTQSWSISDSQLVGKWGYHFSFDSDSTDNSDYSIRSVTVEKQ